MKITLIKFKKEHFIEYKSWFEDEATQKYLGSIDEEWLDHILKDGTGEELVAMLNGEMVGVVGIAFPEMEHKYNVITNMTIHPDLRGKGYGRLILNFLINEYHSRTNWKAFIDLMNIPAQNFLEKAGWTKVEIQDDMVAYLNSK